MSNLKNPDRKLCYAVGMILLLGSIDAFHSCAAAQRMGILRGSVDLIAKGESDVHAYCLDHDVAAPSATTHYTQMLTDPNSVVVTIGGKTMSLSDALNSNLLSWTGDAHNSNESEGFTLHVRNNTNSNVHLEIKENSVLGDGTRQRDATVDDFEKLTGGDDLTQRLIWSTALLRKAGYVKEGTTFDQALAAFQKDQGLATSGKLDDDTLGALQDVSDASEDHQKILSYLKDNGYFAKHSSLEDALKAYQSDNSLDMTGKLDSATTESLEGDMHIEETNDKFMAFLRTAGFLKAGQKPKRGLTAFQKQYGLPETGELDLGTLQAWETTVLAHDYNKDLKILTAAIIQKRDDGTYFVNIGDNKPAKAGTLGEVYQLAAKLDRTQLASVVLIPDDSMSEADVDALKASADLYNNKNATKKTIPFEVANQKIVNDLFAKDFKLQEDSLSIADNGDGTLTLHAKFIRGTQTFILKIIAASREVLEACQAWIKANLSNDYLRDYTAQEFITQLKLEMASGDNGAKKKAEIRVEFSNQAGDTQITVHLPVWQIISARRT